MFSAPLASRQAQAYRTVDAHTAVDAAQPARLIVLLFDALGEAIAAVLRLPAAARAAAFARHVHEIAAWVAQRGHSGALARQSTTETPGFDAVGDLPALALGLRLATRRLACLPLAAGLRTLGRGAGGWGPLPPGFAASAGLPALRLSAGGVGPRSVVPWLPASSSCASPSPAAATGAALSARAAES